MTPVEMRMLRWIREAVNFPHFWWGFFGSLVSWALVFYFGSKGEVIGFFGNVVGGLIGGGMTLAAGWLAWSAAQEQIDQQRTLLNLATQEHKLRKIHLLQDFAHLLTEACGNLMQVTSLPQQQGEVREFKPIRVISGAVESDDFWRLNYDLGVALRRLDSRIRTANTDYLGRAWVWPQNRESFKEMGNRCNTLCEDARRMQDRVNDALKELGAETIAAPGQKFWGWNTYSMPHGARRQAKK
ncbi:hypothetical protein V5F77_27775 [Xanthobacter sp. DSM 24535]|uniref:hypothetical protein n=1 Tax=Roseixanthobacter psychrophilus TaxID=3119917 RepID=UPI0037282051